MLLRNSNYTVYVLPKSNLKLHFGHKGYNIKEQKVQDLISSLRINPAEAESIGLNLNSVAKIVKIIQIQVFLSKIFSRNTKLFYITRIIHYSKPKPTLFIVNIMSSGIH